MRAQSARYFQLFFVILCLTTFGCSGAKVRPTALESWGAPAWVIKGGGAFQDEKGKFFYGVGSASGIRNVSLAITTAENRARNDIAKVLEVYVSSLMRDYAASTTAGDFRATVEEQHIEQAVKTITAVTLSGVMIIDRWESPDGDVYSLARLDMEGFKEHLKEMRGLNAGIRDYVRENAERLHEKLIQEEEKH